MESKKTKKDTNELSTKTVTDVDNLPRSNGGGINWKIGVDIVHHCI